MTDLPLDTKDREIIRLRTACAKQNDEICQVLGKALGYPWLKDDQSNFPDATEADGVCVGDHVAESLADEAGAKIAQLRTALAAATVATAELISASASLHNAAQLQLPNAFWEEALRRFHAAATAAHAALASPEGDGT